MYLPASFKWLSPKQRSKLACVDGSTIPLDIIVKPPLVSGIKAAPAIVKHNPDCPPVSMKPSKSKYDIAIFAMGSFWSPQRRFQKMDGVKRVIVGYTGGDHPAPSFNNTQDHTQAVFVEYNPSKVSYEKLLAMWHDNDFPWEPEESLAYRSAVFVTDQDQYKVAFDFLMKLSKTRSNRKLYVDIEPASTFYQAEEYQQDYLLKQTKAAKEQFLLWANDEASSGLYAIPE